jgi:cation diffusion facilitator CzcD-associated flavoprotein CzcO
MSTRDRIPAQVSGEPAVRLPRHANVVIVGTGFSGLGMAIRLARSGRRDFVVIERGNDVGGTWRDNTYPGAACDVPSRLYSFSFRLNPDWSRSYSPQPEILDYLRRCAQEAGVLPHIRFGTELLGADWDGAAARWRITTDRGELTGRFLVLGTGALVEPARPDIAGLDDFAGTVFHSARWNHEHDLADRRVGVIGTGASAIQFVPHLQREAQQVTVFQRTPPWIVPRPDRAVGAAERWVYRHVPVAHQLARAGVYTLLESRALGFVLHPALLKPVERIALRHLHRAVTDPELRAKLTAHYSIGCKRILVSNDYYPALAADNVEVVTDAITAIEPTGVRTADGVLHEIDTLVLGTGFRVTDNPGFHRVRGRDGQSLAQAWAEHGMRAYLGTTVHGFPNLFQLLGPNTGIGHTSAVYMIESQIELVLGALHYAARHDVGLVEVRAEVEEAWNADLAARSTRTVWKSGCQSWYLDQAGRNTVLWPDLTFRFRSATRHFRPDDYDLVPGFLGAGDEVPAPVAVG